MNPTHQLMLDWLESGDPAKVRHARARIAIGFDGQTGVQASSSAARPRIVISHARRFQLVTCLYRDGGCGCAAPKCWWKGKPVTLFECHECHP